MEEWRAIPGHRAHEISESGVIRRTVDTLPGAGGWRAGKVMKQWLDRDGYATVKIGGALRPVHRLMCEAFHGPAPRAGMVVRHLDDDKTNNAPGNIAWGSHSDNMRDAIRNGRRPDLIKRRFDRAAASAMRDAGAPWVRIAAAMGVSDVAVRKGVMAWRARNPDMTGNPGNNRELTGARWSQNAATTCT